jgi:hypothetical protein
LMGLSGMMSSVAEREAGDGEGEGEWGGEGERGMQGR